MNKYEIQEPEIIYLIWFLFLFLFIMEELGKQVKVCNKECWIHFLSKYFGKWCLLAFSNLILQPFSLHLHFGSSRNSFVLLLCLRSWGNCGSSRSTWFLSSWNGITKSRWGTQLKFSSLKTYDFVWFNKIKSHFWC